MLLERNDINPDPLDRNRETLLAVATQGGHEGVVKMLLYGGNQVKNSSMVTRMVFPLPQQNTSRKNHLSRKQKIFL